MIGLNRGKPFTNNECFWPQYQWAKAAQTHPDVYINLDFPRAGRAEALTGPYGRCEETDDWCRGYNWGYNLAKDAVWRGGLWGIQPGRYWFDVEVDNHWSASTRNNAQVVRGAVDYFLDFNVPMGVYGTRYQWGLITGGYALPPMTPLWVAGARTRAEAERRCDNNTNLAFGGGLIWIAQYYPEGVWDGNVLCPPAVRANAAAASQVTSTAQAATAPSPTQTAAAPTARPAPTATPTASPTPQTLAPEPRIPSFADFWKMWAWLHAD